jgi:hypothetical protein
MFPDFENNFRICAALEFFTKWDQISTFISRPEANKLINNTLHDISPSRV